MVDKVLAAMDEHVREMVGQTVPAKVARRFKDHVLGACGRKRDNAKPIARFKRSDFE